MPRNIGNTWYADFYFGGARHRQKLMSARTRHEAMQAETKLKHELFQASIGKALVTYCSQAARHSKGEKAG